MASKHSVSTVQALYRVFVLPNLSKPIAPLRRGPHLQPHLQPHITTSRPLSHTPSRLAKTRPPEERAQKWNEEIRARQFYLVDPETGRLELDRETEQPILHTRYDVLNSLDLGTHRLVQLDENDPPTCKIVSKKEAYASEKKRRAQQKAAVKAQKAASDEGMKTLELNWAIDQNDLGHRLMKLKGFLGEGRRVEVVLATKKRGRRASPEECDAVLGRIRAAVEEVDGAKAKKEMDGKIGGGVTMQFQGKPVSGAQAKEEA